MKESSELVANRKAFHDYEILETFEAGIELKGTEVKSLKEHGGALQDSYIDIKDHELVLINSSIAPYRMGNVYNHEDRRERKLLMHFSEILKLKKAIKEKGYTLIPLSIYLKKNRIKVKIALAKGSKKHDKREKIKAKEHKKEIQRSLD